MTRRHGGAAGDRSRPMTDRSVCSTSCAVLRAQTRHLAVLPPPAPMPPPGARLYSSPNVSRARRVAALDLGTTKVCCAVAEVASEGLVVQGTGEAPSRGMRKG